MTTQPQRKVCGAKLRKKPGKFCQSTRLMSNGRCRLHGGKTPSGTDSPHFKHGRYANAFKGKMLEHFEQMQKDENPLDMVPDLLVQRAMTQTYLEAVTARKNPKLSELMNASSLAQDAVKSAAIIAQTRQKQALTLAEIKFIQKGMMMLMEKYVPDPEQRRNFIADLTALIPEPDGTQADEPAELPASTT